MECLAVGRGISLPASANASSKMTTYSIYNYSKHRKQFNMPLIKMEGVQNKLVDMVYNTWLIQCGIDLTNHILDRADSTPDSRVWRTLPYTRSPHERRLVSPPTTGVQHCSSARLTSTIM